MHHHDDSSRLCAGHVALGVSLVRSDGANKSISESHVLGAVFMNWVCISVCAGTSLDQDMALLSGRSGKKGLSMEERLAVQFRAEKKKIMKATLTSLGVAA